MPAFPKHGLYCITDAALAGGLSHVEQARRCLEGGARLIQLRHKPQAPRAAAREVGGHAPALVAQARRIAALCHERSALFIVNDDPRLAVESAADGVHVGQQDVPAQEARLIVGPERIVGLSTHTRAQVLAAQELPVDYIGFGPVFPTGTKRQPYAPLGVPEVKWAIRHSALPVVPIGGVTADNLPALLAIGARYAAVISAVVGAPDIAAAARQLSALFESQAA